MRSNSGRQEKKCDKKLRIFEEETQTGSPYVAKGRIRLGLNGRRRVYWLILLSLVIISMLLFLLS